jgi:hypothetical protein
VFRLGEEVVEVVDGAGFDFEGLAAKPIKGLVAGFIEVFSKTVAF